MNTVAGFLVPEWSTDPIPGHKQMHWLTGADTQKVLEGYACGECLADFGGVYRPVCPVCGNTRDLDADVQPFPDVWRDHLAARREAEQNPSYGSTSGSTMEDFVRAVQADKTVEHVSLKKLGKSKWGRK